MRIKEAFFLIIGVFFITACKADRVVVELPSDAIDAAIAGETLMVEFVASFEFIGELDADKKRDIEKVEQVIKENMEVSEFSVTGDGSRTQIEIEGEIPITAGPDLNAPWFFKVTNYVGEAYIIQIVNGLSFERVSRQIKDINFMLAPDNFHPTTIRLKGKDRSITVPAGYVDGEPKIMWTGSLDGRVNLRFSGGLFDDVGGAFVYIH